jgi:hypothetical protein
VQLLVSAQIDTAATVGWCRPVLLLSSSWRQWSCPAVLAHEMMHVRRHDYLVGIIARLAAVLHFYNPLVWWMTKDLCLAQETIADDSAAREVGGREQYLVALSKLALRQDRSVNSLPVLAFAFTSSTFLMRRIKMLQTKDGQRSSSRLLHGFAIGSLVVLAMATSTLRQPLHSQETSREGTRVATKHADRGLAGSSDATIAVDQSRRPSFDLSFIAAVKNGLIGVRPNVIFQRPDMTPVTEMIDAAIKQRVAELGVENDLGFSVADLEQAVGDINIEVTDPAGKAGHRGKLQIGLSAIRSEKPLPLQEFLKAMAPDMTVSRVGSGTVIETPEPAIPAFGPQRHFTMPDVRTVLPGISGVEFEKRKQEAKQIAEKPWFGLWQQVEQHMIAVVLDNTVIDWEDSLADGEFPELQVLADRSKHLALGYDWRGESIEVFCH